MHVGRVTHLEGRRKLLMSINKVHGQRMHTQGAFGEVCALVHARACYTARAKRGGSARMKGKIYLVEV